MSIRKLNRYTSYYHNIEHINGTKHRAIQLKEKSATKKICNSSIWAKHNYSPVLIVVIKSWKAWSSKLQKFYISSRNSTSFSVIGMLNSK